MDDAQRERNLALLQEGFEAYNRGDLTFVAEHAADDIEVFAHRDLINSGTYRGREEFEAWMRNWQEAWSEITIEVRAVDVVGDEHVIVEAWQTAVGAVSGVPVEMRIVQLIGVRDGEITRFHIYPNRDLALADVESL